MSYIDCVIAPVSRQVLPSYLKVARRQGELWMRCGALDFRECVADDLNSGIATSFPRSVRLAEGEVVVLSWATYHSREHRDEVIELAREDPWHAQFERSAMPFDTRRMLFGGFEQVLALTAPAAN